MGLEGALHLGLQLGGGRIAQVRIASTRPDVARLLLQGRTRAEVSAAVPRLFSICGRSQAVASELAFAAAGGDAPTNDTLARHGAAVAAETVRECAWRTLLHWPQSVGEQPTAEAVAAARGAKAPADGPLPRPAREAIARAAFGMGAADWLATTSLPHFDAWLDAGPTASARFLRRVRDDDDGNGSGGASGSGHDHGLGNDRKRAHNDEGDNADTAHPVRQGAHAAALPLLGGADHPAWVGEIAHACEADAGFEQRPLWRGGPAETGALARLRDDILISALAQRSATRVPMRFVARLRELAGLLAGQAAPAVGCLPLAGGVGIAWVETARGLLVHKVVLADGRAASYRIVAPTEWNFHPAGALALALRDAPAGDREAARRIAARVVDSLDPCVALHIEFDDA